MNPRLRTVSGRDAAAERTGMYSQRVRNRGFIACGRYYEVRPVQKSGLEQALYPFPYSAHVIGGVRSRVAGSTPRRRR